MDQPIYHFSFSTKSKEHFSVGLHNKCKNIVGIKELISQQVIGKDSLSNYYNH